MTIQAICTFQEREKVSEAIRINWGEENIDFLCSLDQLEELAGTLILSHSIVPKLKIKTFSNLDNIYIYFSGNVISVKNEDDLDRKSVV